MWPTIILFSGGLFGVGLTYILTRRKEHEADWRKLRFEQYREFLLALSGIVDGRATKQAHFRYADAANSMMLVASPSVLRALDAFLAQTSQRNLHRTAEGHDRLLNTLIHSMRVDMDPTGTRDSGLLVFRLLAPPLEVES